ncbi:MAG TPA: sigma-70 family RNA polymerase sigma factor [Bacteroidia bacterium]|nr:sigma-70 family RNA polymerase sigma factor [Bacteroidia bacterium]
MLNIPDEKTLVEQCRKQNSSAQKVLFDRYFDKMMTICLRYLKREDDALEALNNAFLKVFDKISQYKSEGSLEAWIKRIVINSSLDFVRSNKAYRDNFIHTDELHLYGESGEESISPDEWFNDALDFSKEEIFDLVAELPQASRIVLNLYVVDEFSHRQISKQLKISEGTSRWHLSNARKILKEKITQAVLIKNKKFNHGEETERFR